MQEPTFIICTVVKKFNSGKPYCIECNGETYTLNTLTANELIEVVRHEE